MSKSKDDAPHELESQFVLRLPPVSARCRLRPSSPPSRRRSVGIYGEEEGIPGLGKGPCEVLVGEKLGVRQRCVPADCILGCVLKRGGSGRGGLLPSALPC